MVLDNYNILNCPACGGESLHQERVTAYFRHEDSDVGMVVEVDRETVMANANGDCITGNPSARRDGIVIEFSCENCSVIPRLAIVQHKGTTYFEWLDGVQEPVLGVARNR